MRKTCVTILLPMAWVVLMLMGCEKPVVSADGGDDSELFNVKLRITQLESMEGSGGTRAMTNVSEVCTRLNFLLYQNGKKVKTVNQTPADPNFGYVDVAMASGTYQLLVLAHNCPANPSSASPDKVQFDNKGTGYTDTFFYYGDLDVDDSDLQADLSLRRAVAMFRLAGTAPVPDNVASVRVYYTGGSGALNALTGYGCVNSKQYTMFDVSESTGEIPQFDVYTFLHDETGVLNVLVTAYDAGDNILYEREFKNVAMKRNTITCYTGNVFEDGGSDTPVVPDDPDNKGEDTRHGIAIMVDPEWDAVENYSF